MNIYNITFIIFAIASFIELTSRRSKPFFAFIGYSFILLLGAIRWKTGTDWNSYCDYFYDYQTFSQYLTADESFEYGYKLANAIASTIYRSFSLVLTFGTILSLYSYSRFRKDFRLKRFPATLLFLFWCLLPYGGIFCTRQFWALSICIISLRYVLCNDIKRFVFCIICACCFHSSAIVFLASYYIYQKEFTYKQILIGLLISCVGGLFIHILIDYVVGSFAGNYFVTKLMIYDSEKYGMDSSGLISGLAKRLFTIPLFFYYQKRIKEKKEVECFRGFLNLYLFGTCVYYLFAIANLGQLLRFSVYFQFFEIPLLYYILKKTRSLALILIIYAFCFMKAYTFLQGYPELYMPFETIFETSFKKVY